MSRWRRGVRWWTAASIAVTGLVGWTAAAAAPVPAAPVGEVLVAGPGASLSTYATPVVVGSVSGTLTFVNADNGLHDVVSVDTGSDGQPLFATAVVGFGETVPVTGLAHLTPGRTFAFTCTIHSAMHGTLLAVP
jgi:plastocyanin